MNNKTKKIVFGVTTILTLAALVGMAGKHKHCNGEKSFCKKEFSAPHQDANTTPSR